MTLVTELSWPQTPIEPSKLTENSGLSAGDWEIKSCRSAAIVLRQSILYIKKKKKINILWGIAQRWCKSCHVTPPQLHFKGLQSLEKRAEWVKNISSMLKKHATASAETLALNDSRLPRATQLKPRSGPCWCCSDVRCWAGK